MHYKRRKIDDILDECLKYFLALAIEGPKGVGKTGAVTVGEVSYAKGAKASR